MFHSVCVCTEEMFNQTESTATVSSKPNQEVKFSTESTSIDSVHTETTAGDKTVIADMQILMINYTYNTGPPQKESKIVGGHGAYNGEFPYQVRVLVFLIKYGIVKLMLNTYILNC